MSRVIHQEFILKRSELLLGVHSLGFKHDIWGDSQFGKALSVIQKLVSKNRGLPTCQILPQYFQGDEQGVEVDIGFGHRLTIRTGVDNGC